MPWYLYAAQFASNPIVGLLSQYALRVQLHCSGLRAAGTAQAARVPPYQKGPDGAQPGPLPSAMWPVTEAAPHSPFENGR